MHIAPCHKHALEHFSLPHAFEMMFFTLFFTLQQRNEMIAHLKDQLQEMKAKTSMEGKYIKKDAERSEERRVGKEGRSRWSPYH